MDDTRPPMRRTAEPLKLKLKLHRFGVREAGEFEAAFAAKARRAWFQHGSTLTFQLSQSKLIGENRGCGTRRRSSYASTQLTRLVGGGVPIYPELLVVIEEKNCGRFPRADPKQVQFPPAPSILRNDSRTVRGAYGVVWVLDDNPGPERVPILVNPSCDA